jgi:hypothetical protein
MEEGITDGPISRRKNNPPPTFSSSDLEGVARFLDTDPDYWVFRRFRKLHLLNVLRMELDLVRLEHKLDMQLSERGENEAENDLCTLLPDIQSSLSEYGTVHIQLTFLSCTPPRASWTNKVCLSLDAALSSLAHCRSYREPDPSIVSQLTDWATQSIENNQPLLQGLGIPYPGNTCLKDLASIAAIEKTWTHQFIDKYDCLRRIFVRFLMPTTSQVNPICRHKLTLGNLGDPRRSDASRTAALFEKPNNTALLRGKSSTCRGYLSPLKLLYFVDLPHHRALILAK